MSYLILTSLTFVVGIIVGLTGIGGASLITPMLILLFQVPPAVTVSSVIVSNSLMKVVASVKHCHQKTVDWQIVQWLALGSVPGSLAGVKILQLFRQIEGLNLDTVLLRLIGIVIMLIGVSALTQCLLKNFIPKFQLPALPKLNLKTNAGKILSIFFGAILGCLVGLTSISSGSMFAIVLISFFRLDSQKLVGTNIVQASILLVFTSLAHLGLGTVDWSLVLPIWLGTVPGVIVGAKLCKITPQPALRLIIYTVLITVSWKLIS